MKIGKLNQHCGNCSLIEYCTEPYETPCLCACEELDDVEEERYAELADSITDDEIKDKLQQYEENNISPWDDEVSGAICDIVLEKLYNLEEE